CDHARPSFGDLDVQEAPLAAGAQEVGDGDVEPARRARLRAHVLDPDQGVERGGQRLVDRGLGERGGGGAQRREHQAADPGAELRPVDALARRGQQHLPDQLPDVRLVVGFLAQPAARRRDLQRIVDGLEHLACHSGPSYCALTRGSPSVTVIGPVGAPTALKQAPTLLWPIVGRFVAKVRVLGESQLPTTVKVGGAPANCSTSATVPIVPVVVLTRWLGEILLIAGTCAPSDIPTARVCTLPAMPCLPQITVNAPLLTSKPLADSWVWLLSAFWLTVVASALISVAEMVSLAPPWVSITISPAASSMRTLTVSVFQNFTSGAA